MFNSLLQAVEWEINMTEKKFPKSNEPVPKVVGFRPKPTDEELVLMLRDAAKRAGVSFSEFARAALKEGAPMAEERLVRELEEKSSRARIEFEARKKSRK